MLWPWPSDHILGPRQNCPAKLREHRKLRKTFTNSNKSAHVPKYKNKDCTETAPDSQTRTHPYLRAHCTGAPRRPVSRALNLCIRLSLSIILALAAFFLHAHALALAILGTLNLIAHVRNLLIDTLSDALNASGFGERHACTMLREMGRAPRRTLQAAAGHHYRDRAFLN